MTQVQINHDGTELGPCWEWTGRRIPKGYGQIGRRYTHRLSYTMAFGDIPDGLWVLHRCDNPPCLRPDHLFLGTNTDNQRDSAAKGRNGRWTHPERTVRGARCHTAKLTSQQVHDVRRRFRPGRGHPDNMARLADEYGVSRSSIYAIVHGKSWGHLS